MQFFLQVWLPVEEITGAVLMVPHGPLGMATRLITSMVVMGCSGQGAQSHLWVGMNTWLEEADSKQVSQVDRSGR